MMGMLRAYLAKERRDGRALLLGIPAALTVVLVGGSFLVPERFLRDPFFPQIAAAAGVVLGLLAVAADVVPGETRRDRMRLLARLPGGLGTAWVAKMVHVVASLAFLGVFGFAAGKLVAAAWGVPLLDDSLRRALHSWTSFFQSGWGPAVALVIAAAGWVLAVSTWLPRGSLAVPAAGLVLGVFGLPLWLLYRSAPGLRPFDGFVVFFGAALILAPYAIGAISFVRGRRYGRGPWGSAWRGLLATGVLFAPAWAFGAFEVHDHRTVDPWSERFRIAGGDVGEGGRFLFVNSLMVRRFSNAGAGARSQDGPSFPILVDLETGGWKRMGDAGDTFLRWSTGQTPSLMSVRDSSATVDGPRGREVWLRWIDGRTGELVKSGWGHIRYPELEPYRPARPETVPEGYDVREACGLGLRVVHDGKSWIWDPFREKAYARVALREYCWIHVRPGRWLAFRAWRTGARPCWVLLDPETGEESRLEVPRRTTVWTMLPDGRAVIWMAEGRRARIVDPETMEGPEIGVAASWMWCRGRTRAGALVVEILGPGKDDRGQAHQRYVRLDVKTGEAADFGGDVPRTGLEVMAAVDEETLIAIHENRRVVRLRRGSEEMEVLFPR